MNQLGPILQDGRRFICVTHSTGGPVVRDWWHRFYESKPDAEPCPMSHLIMLAPANFGSALAQLGKSRVGRLKAWFGGVEPGQGVLDWLELGSRESWQLNRTWIATDQSRISPHGVFPFVLTGQRIDRKLYDHLNSYTGESGSDGVIRVAAANLNARYVRLEQDQPTNGRKGWSAPGLSVAESTRSPETALRVIRGKSHSGEDMGIMASVQPSLDDSASNETVDCILRCMRVRSPADYATLCHEFAAETATVQEEEKKELAKTVVRPNRVFVHDRYSMVIFLVRDNANEPVADFDLLLTAGPRSSPNHLPEGFFVDRQRNRLTRGAVTYYFNSHVMFASPAVKQSPAAGTSRRRPPRARGGATPHGGIRPLSALWDLIDA
jgi:hypothetical protein